MNPHNPAHSHKYPLCEALCTLMMIVNDTLEGWQLSQIYDFVKWFEWRLDEGWRKPKIDSPLYATEHALQYVCKLALAEYRKKVLHD